MCWRRVLLLLTTMDACLNKLRLSFPDASLRLDASLIFDDWNAGPTLLNVGHTSSARDAGLVQLRSPNTDFGFQHE